MKPISIEFQAFGPYAGHEVVDFEAISKKGLFLICGKTGTGKTMILDAMTFALYGKSSGHGRDDFEAMRCTNAEAEVPTFVKFIFENNGEYYLFERRLERKRKNFSASYNLMRRDADGVWRVLLENAKDRALNDKAVEIIGLEYDQFRQVIVLPQGQFERLLTSGSDEKEKILTSIFGENKWQEIAENLYNEVSLRKDSLREKKDRIVNSLLEEKCNSISELNEAIEVKAKNLATLEADYYRAEYDNRVRFLQDSLILAKRFEDLKRNKNRLSDLKNQRPQYDNAVQRIADASRAAKVVPFLDEVKVASSNYDARVLFEKKMKDANINAEKLLKDIQIQLEQHISQNESLETKKAQVIQYTEKKKAYEDIDDEYSKILHAQTDLDRAKDLEKKGQISFDRIAPQIESFKADYDRLNNEHKMLLDGYLAGITGIIAETLVDNTPCPVCGSTVHPHKAVKADDSVTKDMVDRGKQAAEDVYLLLQKKLEEQVKARQELDRLHNEVIEKGAVLKAEEATLNAMKKNLVDGILNLSELEGIIASLSKEINIYVAQKERLELKEKEARDACIRAKTQASEANKESLLAREKLDEARKAVAIKLNEQGFMSEDDARALELNDKALEDLKGKVVKYEEMVNQSQTLIKELEDEIGSIPEPDAVACKKELDMISEAKAEYARQSGILSKELERLRQKADRLVAEGDGIEDQIRQAEEDFVFAKKVRGDSGTGIQRYVLGIMFSSVITAANKMLEMVHGGRYRLFRSDEKAQGSNKRGLELKVYDKNSGNIEGRFVSTLSGGEKFLASLALSIGMSTIAQKSGIRIDALFIDEGFGSLDEDSIDDAMNILNFIQEANGLVGIISHVQLLQDRIPTKLKVEEVENGSKIVHSIG